MYGELIERYQRLTERLRAAKEEVDKALSAMDDLETDITAAAQETELTIRAADLSKHYHAEHFVSVEYTIFKLIERGIDPATIVLLVDEYKYIWAEK